MKTLITLLLILISCEGSCQVYAEFYNTNTGDVFLTDSYQVLFYDNAIDTTGSTAGFQAKLIFINYNDSLRTVYSSKFMESEDLCIIRLRIWDEKLYGYCYVGEVDNNTDRVIVTLIGSKNVPQRKKLLFKDSSRLRMWDHPWIGD